MIESIIVPIIVAIIPLFGIAISHFSTLKSIKGNENNIIKEIDNQQNINDRNLSAQYITDNRVEWIQELRKLISEFLSVASPLNDSIILTDKKHIDQDTKNIERISRIRNQIVLMLNAEEDTNQKLIIDIDNMHWFYSKLFETVRKRPRDAEAKKQYSDLVSKYAREAIIDAQVCLKFEWNRVKKEALGEKYPKIQQKIDKDILYRNIKKAYSDIIIPELKKTNDL